MKRRIQITGWTSLSLLFATVAGFATWAYSPYPADADAVREVFARDDISVHSTAHLLVMEPAGTDTALDEQALLFIPGARVEPHAYAKTLADVVAENGITVVIVRPLANLALLDTRGLDAFQELSPHPIRAVAGHSLGGVKACQLAKEDQVDVLILFASYCVNDLSARDLDVVTVLGSADALTDREAVEDAGVLLPSSSKTVEVVGANHASFADYGPQSGDGVATVSREDMIDRLTAVVSTLVGDSANPAR